jgi:hypothetical protein
MELYLNERKLAEHIIQSGEYRDEAKDVLSLLARYYYHIMQIHRKKQIFEFLDSFMQRNYNNYDVGEWSELMNLYIKNAKRYPLIEIDFIPVTQAELDDIAGLNDDKLKRLAFTALVLAKFGDRRNKTNNSWVMVKSYALFKRAGLRDSRSQLFDMVHDIRKQGLVKLSRKVNNVNFRVNFVNDDSPVVMQITDMRELGLQYMNHIYGGYRQCRECGKWFKMNVHNHSYCDDCVQYVEYHTPMVTKMITCCDCGKEFEVNAKNNWTVRCDDCYSVYRRKYKTRKQLEYRK